MVVDIFIVAVYRLGRKAWAIPDRECSPSALRRWSVFGIVPTLLLAGALGVARHGDRRACIVAVAVILGLVGLARFAGSS